MQHPRGLGDPLQCHELQVFRIDHSFSEAIFFPDGFRGHAFHFL